MSRKLGTYHTLPGDFSCLNPAQRAAEKILTKYNVAHSLKTTGEMDVTDAQSFFHAFPLLSQVLPHVLDPPLAAHMGEPNQVQCRTLVGIIRKTKLSGYMKRKDPPSRAGLSFHGIRQRPTLPGRLQPSTIGAERLNFCVRYGNRWIPFAIVTGKL